MRVLIDTNVIIDIALERQPFFADSEAIIILVEQGQIEGYVSASTYSDLYYILRKARGHQWTLDFLLKLSNLCQIATVDRAVISLALTLGFSDFEDAIQCATAIVNQLDAIVTRDVQDYTQSSVQIFTPIALIQSLE